MASEDRIRDLCAQAVAAEKDDEALKRIIPQLRKALQELIGANRFHKDLAVN